MRDRPILFSAPMVRALLAGTKTQTRRALRVQPPRGTYQVSTWHHPDPRPHFFAWQELPHETAMIADDWAQPCPYGQPGDRLWVREAWRAELTWDTTKPSEIPDEAALWYEADDHQRNNGRGAKFKGKLRPGMFMPRWASRILLEVTGVRVERLQDISEADAIAEGIENDPRLDPAGTCHWRVYGAAQSTGTNLPERSYESLWTSINGPGSWDANPWVWAVSFKKVGGADEQR